MEIVGSKEEVRLYKVQRNRQQCESSGSLRLLGLLPHITGDKVQCTSQKQCEFSGQPCQHPLCHRRGKNFTFFWPHWCFLFNPGTSLILDGDLLSSSGTAKLARPWACSRPGSRQIRIALLIIWNIMGPGVFDSFTDLDHHSGVATLAHLSGVISLLSPMYLKYKTRANCLRQRRC